MKAPPPSTALGDQNAKRGGGEMCRKIIATLEKHPVYLSMITGIISGVVSGIIVGLVLNRFIK